MDGEVLRIGELGRANTTKVETVRYYERIGLLPKARRTGSGKYRAYTRDHVRRLAFIRHARELGFTLDQVRALLSLSDQRQRSCAAVDAIAQEHLVDVDRKSCVFGRNSRRPSRAPSHQSQHIRIGEWRGDERRDRPDHRSRRHAMCYHKHSLHPRAAK